jgi:hypothetical protein
MTKKTACLQVTGRVSWRMFLQASGKLLISLWLLVLPQNRVEDALLKSRKAMSGVVTGMLVTNFFLELGPH